MSTLEAIAEQVKVLPPERQQEVLDFVEFIRSRMQAARTPRASLGGIWKDLHVDITEEGIAEARREMWGNFPREDIFR